MRAGKQRTGRAIKFAHGMDGDPAAVAVVRRIFTEFTELYAHATLNEVAAGLNTDGIPTARGGKAWYASTVRYVLRNDVYAALLGRATFYAAQSRLARVHSGPPK